MSHEGKYIPLVFSKLIQIVFEVKSICIPISVGLLKTNLKMKSVYVLSSLSTEFSPSYSLMLNFEY